jgi:hypothetical protein
MFVTMIRILFVLGMIPLLAARARQSNCLDPLEHAYREPLVGSVIPAALCPLPGSAMLMTR